MIEPDSEGEVFYAGYREYLRKADPLSPELPDWVLLPPVIQDAYQAGAKRATNWSLALPDDDDY